MRKVQLVVTITIMAFTLSACALLGYHADPMVPFGEHAVAKFDKEVAVYAVNDRKNKILYVAPEIAPPQLWLYQPSTDTSKRINSAQALPGVDKITYTNGAFRVWYEGAALVEVVVDAQRPAKKSPTVAKQ